MRVASSTLLVLVPMKSLLFVDLSELRNRITQQPLIRKIKPLAVELRRPSILRASGHTFEYLGYGPGNYSTGLPQVQVRTLSEREDFLAQAQENLVVRLFILV